MKLLSVSLLPVFVSSALGLTYTVDSSNFVSETTYARALSENFTKAIIRGYHEACTLGGEVDPNFVSSYNNARAAGYRDIDMYWFPCTGVNSNCKSYPQQVTEITATFKAHKMQIGTIWITIGKDLTSCHNWNYGPSGNLDQAKQLVNATRSVGFNFGINSSPGEWSTVFGSTEVVLDPSSPLWFATYNNVQNVTLGTPFGGWTTAVGHQYTRESVSGKFDLSVFV